MVWLYRSLPQWEGGVISLVQMISTCLRYGGGGQHSVLWALDIPLYALFIDMLIPCILYVGYC
jgi:hypothetical protein